MAQEHKEHLKVSAEEVFLSSFGDHMGDEWCGDEGERTVLMVRILQSREKKQTKLEQSGLSQEELLRQQEELFGSARAKFNQQGQHEQT